MSFDAVAHAKGLSFIPLSQQDLADAYVGMNHGRIREHLVARVTTMWSLWLDQQPDGDALAAATAVWLAEQMEAQP